jgi:hypothetical protein
VERNHYQPATVVGVDCDHPGIEIADEVLPSTRGRGQIAHLLYCLGHVSCRIHPLGESIGRKLEQIVSSLMTAPNLVRIAELLNRPSPEQAPALQSVQSHANSSGP